MSIRRKIGDYLRDKLGVSETRENLQGKIDYLQALVSLNLPEVIFPYKEIESGIDRKLSKEFGDISFFRGIHRNDVMFRHHLYHHARIPAEAFLSYYQVGARTASNLQKFCKEQQIRVNKILDFGAGYGRVSRFFPLFFPDSGLWVSEVKEQALQFQSEEMGFKTITHSQSADSFPQERFDLILALSVFTHLPEDNFRKWLGKLSETLNPGGALVFSFNNSERVAVGDSPQDFHYTIQSEDSFFIVPDRLADQQQYGLSFVSQQKLRYLADKLGFSISFHGPLFSGKQEVALLRK